MPLPNNIPVHITPENVWAILDAAESDNKGELADTIYDSDTEFVIDDEEIAEPGDDDAEEDNIPLSARVKIRDPVPPTSFSAEPIYWTDNIEYISPTKDCTVQDPGKVLLPLEPWDSPLAVFEKLLDLDAFLQPIQREFERHAVSM